MSELINLMIIQIIVQAIINSIIVIVPFLVLYVSNKLKEKREIKRRDTKIRNLYHAFESCIKFESEYSYRYLLLHRNELELIGVVAMDGGRFRTVCGDFGSIIWSGDGLYFNTRREPCDILIDLKWFINNNPDYGMNGEGKLII